MIEIALIVLILIQEILNRLERRRLIEAFLAKNLGEIKELEQTRKIIPIKPKEEIPMIPVNELDESVFDKYIQGINKAKQEVEE